MRSKRAQEHDSPKQCEPSQAASETLEEACDKTAFSELIGGVITSGGMLTSWLKGFGALYLGCFRVRYEGLNNREVSVVMLLST